MKYHITIARNDVIGKLEGSRSPCSLDDFDEPCTTVIVKKKTGGFLIIFMSRTIPLLLGLQMIADRFYFLQSKGWFSVIRLKLKIRFLQKSKAFNAIGI